jgi:nitrite reductase/ring-hydroxylating ferredoxin subunit
MANRAEIVIQNNYIRSILSHIRPRDSHRQTHIRSLTPESDELIKVVCTIHLASLTFSAGASLVPSPVHPIEHTTHNT